MANQTGSWRVLLLAAIISLVVLAPNLASAQDNGNRPADDRSARGDRGGDRPARGWRRNGEGGGEKGRDRGPDRNGGDNGRPPEPRPATPPSAPAAAPSSTSFGTVSDAEKIRKMASDTIKKNDKNSDGILEGDELKDLGVSRNADKNGDGKINKDELVEYYTPKSDKASSPPPAPTTQPKVEAKTLPESSTPRKTAAATHKSYRFKSTKERLSTWKFASKDANGDGQVSMSEFSSTWNDRTAAEFQRYDKDNDGMITADEAK